MHHMTIDEPRAEERPDSLTRIAADTVAQLRTRWQTNAIGNAVEVKSQQDRLMVLEERLRDGLQDGADAARHLALISQVSELRQDLLEQRHTNRLNVLARIQESTRRLQDATSPQELIEAAPRELCRSCGFSRALISQVHGSTWVPQVVEVRDDEDPDAGALRSFIAEAEIPLHHMLLEAELVRRRAPSLVTDPRGDVRTHPEMIAATRTRSYVAAPIMPTGRVIGFLHADRFGRDEDVDLEDRDNLWAFAEQFGLLFQRSVLLARLAAQRAQLHDALYGAQASTDELYLSKVRMEPHNQCASFVREHVGTSYSRPAESRLDSLLTPREREIVALMASGATNTKIAETLVIAEGTVKSHVKRVLRKFHVGSRAECVARYLNLVMREREAARS